MSALEPITAPRLSLLAGVRHGFFTRVGGVSRGVYRGLNLGQGSADDPGAVEANRALAAGWFGAPPERLLSCRQVHSARVVTTEGPFEERPEADGAATATLGLVCGALAADCAPILMADPEAGAVAAVHAGWKGALTGVIEAGVEALVGLGAQPSRIVAAVGPCIGPDSYEVGLEFLDRFTGEDPASAGYFRAGVAHDKRMFDLPGYVLSRLSRAGVEDAEWVGRDTYAEPELFYSNRRALHRGEADYGRLLSAIAII